MAQQHHKKGEVLKLMGRQDGLLNLMIGNKQDRDWATEQLINEGPPHKQVLNSLLLNRLAAFVSTCEHKNGVAFTPQEGVTITTKKEETVVPVVMPINAGEISEIQVIANSISQAPEHEVLIYAITLQVLEWAMKCNERHTSF